ncbi:MAG: hypothetical protein KGJ41_05490 [Rhodospirillales bacterium]|nr:hypothetical protein [Rhodospirillales bacterium]
MSAVLIMARRILIAAWRYRWAAVALSWIVCGAGWTIVYLIPNQYEASARLYVNVDAVLTPLLRGIALDNSLNGQLDILQRTLLSRPNLEKLVSNTDLDLRIRGPADMETMVNGLAQAITITPQTENLFRITYRNTSPKLAYDVVQAVLTTFIESRTGNNRAEMDNAQLFLQQQIAGYERQLRDAEKKRADFRAKYVDLLPAGAGGVSGLEQADATVHDLQGRLADEVAKRDVLNAEIAKTPPLVVTESAATAAGPGGTALDPRVEAAQRELDDLLLRDTNNHPDVIAARKRLAALKAEAASHAAAVASAIAAEKAAMAKAAIKAARDKSATDAAGKDSTGSAAVPALGSHSLPNPVYEQLKVRLVEAQSSIASLQRQVADAVHNRDRLNEIARSAPGLQAEYINLNRDYDVLRKNYQELLARRESMRIATAAQADADKIKIQVVDPPQVPQNPVAPKRALLLFGVLIAGLASGLGLAVLLVQFDQSFHTIDELRDLGLPVAGGVSLLNVAVVRGRLTAVFLFAMSVLLLGGAYLAISYRVLHTTGGI